MDENRFCMNFSEMELSDSQGKKISQDVDENLFLENVELGDIIKRKGLDVFYKISDVHYEIPGIGYFDFVGQISDEEGNVLSSKLFFFNQKDIEYKVIMKRKR